MEKLIPAFVLIGHRLSEKAGAVLLVALLVLPYVNLGIIVEFRERYPSTVRLFPEFTFLWIPLLVILCWFATEMKRQPQNDRIDPPGQPPSDLTSIS